MVLVASSPLQIPLVLDLYSQTLHQTDFFFTCGCAWVAWVVPLPGVIHPATPVALPCPWCRENPFPLSSGLVSKPRRKEEASHLIAARKSASLPMLSGRLHRFPIQGDQIRTPCIYLRSQSSDISLSTSDIDFRSRSQILISQMSIPQISISDIDLSDIDLSDIDLRYRSLGYRSLRYRSLRY